MNDSDDDECGPSAEGIMNGYLHNDSPSPDDNSSLHNDCSKKCTSNEVRTRLHHFNNLTNRAEDSTKVNNNAGPSRLSYRYQNGASSSRADDNVDSPSEVDKCPSKVHNGSIDGGARRRCRRARCDDEDSSSENEGEDCCVYTYKGNLQADLPSSFLTLDRLANGVENITEEPRELAQEGRNSPGSSPDNDFLEMDFDPGPSLELDMEDESEPVPDLPQENDLSADNVVITESAEYVNNVVIDDPQPGPSGRSLPAPLPTAVACSGVREIPYSAPQQQWSVRDPWGHHCASGDLCTPWDGTPGESGELWSASGLRGEAECYPRECNMFSDFYHRIMAKRLVMDKNASFTEVGKHEADDVGTERQTPPVDRTMIWSEQEASAKQVTQISTSACGATAVINVMMALNRPFSLEKIKKGVSTRLRQENAQIPQYLLSRSNAGATHEDLIRGVHEASEGCLLAKFFHMYPARRFSLLKWLAYWMRKGAVPIATLNLQTGLPPDSPVPDAWHHQMVFGVSPRGVFLSNPLECVPEGVLHTQLSSPSVLKVKRSDIIQRWTSTTDLTPLMRQKDVRWKKMNVLGQVVNVIRESCHGHQSSSLTKYIVIPADYQSGITLIIPRDSPGSEELLAHAELPFLYP